jgi:hypothetical protein
MPKSTGASDYEAKVSYETNRIAQLLKHTGPAPFGDPLSGVVIVVESTAGTKSDADAANARLVDALRRSLAAIKLDRAYVTWSGPNLLEEILSVEPAALVAIGSATHAIDSSGYPLVRTPFSEASEGSWFAWTKSTSGLKLPALAPALRDTEAKRQFWGAFLNLRALGPEGRFNLHP